MIGFRSPFGGSGDDSGLFDEYGEFVSEHNPTPGWFLEGQDILGSEDHIAFHETTREIFEDRGVYDMTFGYNLARLNLDTRHPDAGYRYARETDDLSVLRAEFTPTTPFCPQSDTLTKGSFRAWNESSDRHEYDLVRVRVTERHHRSDEINRALKELETAYHEAGALTQVAESRSQEGKTSRESGCWDSTGTTSRGYGPDAPF